MAYNQTRSTGLHMAMEIHSLHSPITHVATMYKLTSDARFLFRD